MTSETTLQCAVCGESTDDARLVSECMSCSRTFHLNPFNDADHKDCGDALIGPTQGVEFWCETCLAKLNEEMTANPPDPRGVIDDLAVPPEFQRQRPPAQDQRTAADARPGAPPARRPRSRPAKRYRRIDD